MYVQSVIAIHLQNYVTHHLSTYTPLCRLISAELLRKDQNERLTMTELLLEPIFHSKVLHLVPLYAPFRHTYLTLLHCFVHV